MTMQDVSLIVVNRIVFPILIPVPVFWRFGRILEQSPSTQQVSNAQHDEEGNDAARHKK
jgi:hypothetical protein